ncbi:helix-turn-helix transcriptional regulator [Azospirillum halopraeferens]|uniref:helix-turn-helix transcriptional regulator n=1 Tax=Azospirillum halopraeferens TaxID=34010 RepID=UPI0004117376|nr:LuxR C-terminal-related transcriptional regulator [Azospirillum halopraeferens]
MSVSPRSATTMSATQLIIENANATGAALMVFDHEDRVCHSNERNSKVFSFLDFSRSPTYADVFRASLEHRRFIGPEPYREPDAWLSQAQQFRRNHRFAQFTKEYPDGRIYLVTHEVLAGTGSYLCRVDITDKLAQSLRGSGPLLGPRAWLGALGGLTSNPLDANSGGVAVITASGILVDANSTMRAMLGESTAFGLMGGRIRFRMPAENDDFYTKLAAVLANGDPNGFDLLRVSGEQQDEYLVKVAPFSVHTDRSGAGMAMVSVFDPHETADVPASALTTMYGLTPAESRVALAIGQGDRPEQVAQKYGTSLNTVRTQLQTVFAKMDIGRQPDLVRLVTRLALFFRPRIQP